MIRIPPVFRHLAVIMSRWYACPKTLQTIGTIAWYLFQAVRRQLVVADCFCRALLHRAGVHRALMAKIAAELWIHADFGRKSGFVCMGEGLLEASRTAVRRIQCSKATEAGAVAKMLVA